MYKYQYNINQYYMLYQHISREFFPSWNPVSSAAIGQRIVSGSISLRRTEGAVSPCFTIAWLRKTLVVGVVVFFCGALLVGLSCFGFVLCLCFGRLIVFWCLCFSTAFCVTPDFSRVHEFWTSSWTPPRDLHKGCTAANTARHSTGFLKRTGMAWSNINWSTICRYIVDYCGVKTCISMYFLFRIFEADWNYVESNFLHSLIFSVEILLSCQKHAWKLNISLESLRTAFSCNL